MPAWPGHRFGRLRGSDPRQLQPRADLPAALLTWIAFDFTNGSVAARVKANAAGTIAHEVRTLGCASHATTGDPVDTCHAGPDRSSCLHAAQPAGGT